MPSGKPTGSTESSSLETSNRSVQRWDKLSWVRGDKEEKAEEGMNRWYGRVCQNSNPMTPLKRL